MFFLDVESLVTMALGFLCCGSFFYLILCVDPNDTGILGKMHRFFYKIIPSLLKKLGPNSKVTRCADCFFNYLCYTNHPLVQYFYLLVAVGGYILYCYVGLFKHFYDNPEVSSNHQWIAAILALFSFHTYYLACSHGPGEITKQNVKKKLDQYKDFFDNIMYMQDNKCATCNLVKPARSKHCKVCKMCVSRFDHHCIWIRQCVGEQNYKYFLLFIIQHAFLCLYGGVIGLYALYGICIQKNLFQAQFRVPITGEIVPASWLIIGKYIFYTETMFVFIILLCWIMGVTLFIFFIYHLSMVSQDFTTNERIKRSDYLQYIQKQIAKIKSFKPKEDTTQQQIEENQTRLTNLERDLKQLQNWHKSDGLIKNLKKIIYS